MNKIAGLKIKLDHLVDRKQQMKPSDIPLVRGGKLTPEIIEWIEKVSKVFPGIEKDMVIIRKPGSGLYRAGGKQASQQARKETSK